MDSPHGVPPHVRQRRRALPAGLHGPDTGTSFAFLTNGYPLAGYDYSDRGQNRDHQSSATSATTWSHDRHPGLCSLATIGSIR